MKAQFLGLISLVFGLSPVTANAATLTYSVNAFYTGLTNNNLGDITGSFTMDPGTPTSISNIDINASLPKAVLGPSGFQLFTVNVNFDQAVFPDQTWPIGYLWFTNPATNGGNPWNTTFLMFVRPVDSATYSIGPGFNNHDSEIDFGGDGWTYLTGELTVTQTPLPAAFPLLATGIGSLGLLGWRRKRKAQAN
jgi:hypothetical protein